MEPLAEGRRERLRAAVVIPALNEEEPIAGVVAAVPRDAVDAIFVVDSGSTDRTAERARAAGAAVVTVAERGYGRACRAGADAAAAEADIIVFLDGDGSDRPELIPQLLAPIRAGEADFVVGSRTRGEREAGSMEIHQIAAGWAIGWVSGLVYGVRYTDMCPFRAITRQALAALGMREMTYGWNLEMQLRAARARLRILEIPVAHRRRAGGQSKVSGNLKGSIRAGAAILATLARVIFTRD